MGSLGRVDVLRPLVRVEGPAAEAQDPPLGARDREHDARDEEVGEIASLPPREPRPEDLVVREALGARAPGERRAVAGGIADAEPPQQVGVEAARGEVVPGRGGLVRLPEELLEEPRRAVEEGLPLVLGLARGPGRGVLVLVLDRHAEPLRQELDRLVEPAGPLLRLGPVDGVTGGVAAVAVVPAEVGREQGERWRSLLVERASAPTTARCGRTRSTRPRTSSMRSARSRTASTVAWLGGTLPAYEGPGTHRTPNL